MKKFLLSAALVAFTLAANATDRVVRKDKMQPATSIATLMNQDCVVFNGTKANRAAKHNAKTETIDMIDAGVSETSDGVELRETSAVTIYLTGDQTSQDGVTIDIVDIDLAGSQFAGFLTEDRNTLILPTGQSFMNEKYGEFILLGIFEQDGELGLFEEGEIVYTKNPETGVYECDCVGWYIYMNDGDYATLCWNRSFDSQMMIPNGVETGSITTGNWSDYENPIYVLDSGDEVTIYNFFGETALDMIVDEGDIYIPMHQPVGITSSSLEEAGYGSHFRLLGCTLDDEGYIHIDEEKEYTMGVFATVEIDEDGKGYLEASSNNILTDPTGDGYMGIFTEFDSENRGYYKGYVYQINFTLNEGEYKAVATGDGIKNVNAKASNGVKVNLLGQKIGNDAKGIVVLNGKKYAVK